MAETVGQSFSRGRNNFDVLRLAGAWLVLLSHSFVLTGHSAAEPISLLLRGATDGGRLAVDMFFVVSGFLVTRSVLTHAPGDYFRGRLLRLWPALAVLLSIQTLVLGPAFTSLPTLAYLTDRATWGALGRGLVFNPRLGLPGVFSANPLPDAVNGSLWTLRLEFGCYILLLAAAQLRLLRVHLVLAATAGALVWLAWGGAGWWPADFRLQAVLDCGVQFLMGVSLWLLRDRIPRRPWVAALCLLALPLAATAGAASVVFHIAFSYLVICVGLSRPVGERFICRLGDVSYGTYLYAFPIQQALLAVTGGGIGPWALAAAASPPVLLAAFVSQRLVERPALRLKRRSAAVVAGRPAVLGRIA